MSFRGRDNEGGNANKMDMEPRRFGGMDDRSMNDEMDERSRYDSGRGRRPPFGRGRRPSPGRDRPRDYGYGRDDPPGMRDRSPMRGSDDRFSDRYKKDDGAFMKREDRDRRDTGRSFFGREDSHRDRFMDKPRLDSFDTRFDSPDPFKSRGMNFPSAAPPHKMYTDGFPKPNECEIIAVNKQQRAYAESVELRVKEIGLVVDVLFLKDEALLTQTIDDIARRGSLYAMVINPQNETHGSVTVNILHGTPQEHRNMPLEDALKLLSQNFHKHIRLQRENMERERAERGPYVGNVAADREIQLLLRMLADGRWLSELELNTVIRYLTERRDKMTGNAEEDGRLARPPIPSSGIKMDPPFKPKDDLDVAQKEQDLQDRIMNIMNQGVPPTSSQGANLNMMPNMDMPPPRSNQPLQNPNSNSMPPPTGMGANIPGLKSDDKLPTQGSLEHNTNLGESAVKTPFSSAAANLPTDTSVPSTFINFGDPSVQKALDNLIQTGPNILKNIKSTLSNPPPNANIGNLSKPPISSSGIGSSNDSMQRGNLGMNRGPGGMMDMMSGSGPRGAGNLDAGASRGPGGMPDMGPSRGGPGGMSDMGPSRGGPGGMPDMGSSRGGPGGMSDMGPSRGGPGGMPDMNPSRGGPGGMQDMGPSRGGPGGMTDMGGQRNQRNTGSDMMGMRQTRFSPMPDMGGMSSREFGSGGGGAGGMQDMGRMGPPRGGGNMGPPPGRDSGMSQGMGSSNDFPRQDQFGQYKGPNNNFPGNSSYNSGPGMGNMRQNYGGSQNMGGGPRRY